MIIACFEPTTNLSPVHIDVGCADVGPIWRVPDGHGITERVSNLRLSYNGVLAAFIGTGV